LLMTDLPCMQEVPPTEPVEEGDEGEWDTVGEPAGSRSPAPTVEELIAQLERQPPCLSREHRTRSPRRRRGGGRRSAGGRCTATVAAEEVAAAEAQEEAPAEGGLVDIASILGAPAVTIVRSSL
jgi:hypothetical protein